MQSPALFIHHPRSSQYKFNDEHPFDPVRIKLTIDLLKKSQALTESDIHIPTFSVDEQLLCTVHRNDYVKAVQKWSHELISDEDRHVAEQYGLYTEDTPIFPGIHEAAAAIVAGTMEATEAVMSGRTQHAFHVAGGLHHAFPERASGFCVYNDAAIAIRHIRNKYKARVLYIDTDVHHGDGVQWIYYDDPDVCTYSIHETGKFLFPGTGFVHEKGIDLGHGTCYNIPLEPYTEDESWMESFVTTLSKVINAFKPDLIISQHGCDAHAYDPLSNLHCSMGIYREIPALIHQLAHTYTGGKWVALGGGGYDMWRVVPRAWSMVWLEMIDHPLIQAIKDDPAYPLPHSWIDHWQRQCTQTLPQHWIEEPEPIPLIPRKDQITEKNRITQSIVIQDL